MAALRITVKESGSHQERVKRRVTKMVVSYLGTVLFTGVAMYGVFAENPKALLFGALMMAMRLSTQIDRVEYCISKLSEASD